MQRCYCFAKPRSHKCSTLYIANVFSKNNAADIKYRIWYLCNDSSLRELGLLLATARDWSRLIATARDWSRLIATARDWSRLLATARNCSRLSRSPLFYRMTLWNALARGGRAQSRVVAIISDSFWTGLYKIDWSRCCWLIYVEKLVTSFADILGTYFRYAPILMQPIVRGLVLCWLVIYLSIAIFGCTRLKEGLRPVNLLVDDSYARPHYLALEDYFWKYGAELQVR
jgi:hypothetical protein